MGIAPHHDSEDMELSYEFAPVVWGRGIAAETAAAVIFHAFQCLGYEHLVAETQAANLPSRRLLERLGMSFKKETWRYGERQVIYSIARPHRG